MKRYSVWTSPVEVWQQIRAEWPARRRQSVPWRVQVGAITEPIRAWMQGAEFVGAQGGLQYNREFKDWE